MSGTDQGQVFFGTSERPSQTGTRSSEGEGPTTEWSQAGVTREIHFFFSG